MAGCRLLQRLVTLTTLSIALSLVIACSRGDLGAGAAGSSNNVTGSSRLSELLSGRDVDGYAQALEPRRFTFPADHGPHPAFRNEWWYVTGNLDSDNGARFGFELTFFRFSLTPAVAASADATSAWRTNQVYIGHFALTDVDGNDFHVAQRFSRASLGLAGASASPFRVWLEDWSIEESQQSSDRLWLLHAADDDIALSLSLNRQRSPVLQGDAGLSQKSDEPGNASYYYSIPRLTADGTLQLGERTYSVSGLSWLDREWGSSALAEDQQGWDWFALQLSDGSDLMFYRLRKTDGSIDEHSAGTLIRRGSEPQRLSLSDVSFEPLRFWQSPLGGRYPLAWRIGIEHEDLDLTISPVLDAQELETTVRYWEGAVDVRGSIAGKPIDGRGYVELTGYSPER